VSVCDEKAYELVDNGSTYRGRQLLDVRALGPDKLANSSRRNLRDSRQRSQCVGTASQLAVEPADDCTPTPTPTHTLVRTVTCTAHTNLSHTLSLSPAAPIAPAVRTWHQLHLKDLATSCRATAATGTAPAAAAAATAAAKPRHPSLVKLAFVVLAAGQQNVCQINSNVRLRVSKFQSSHCPVRWRPGRWHGWQLQWWLC
jgi:hypothetical protein